jgi:hypothetical protein
MTDIISTARSYQNKQIKNWNKTAQIIPGGIIIVQAAISNMNKWLLRIVEWKLIKNAY